MTSPTPPEYGELRRKLSAYADDWVPVDDDASDCARELFTEAVEAISSLIDTASRLEGERDEARDMRDTYGAALKDLQEDDCVRAARNIAVFMAAELYPGNEFKPFDGLAGLLSQIDNMAAGTPQLLAASESRALAAEARAEAAEGALRAVRGPLANLEFHVSLDPAASRMVREVFCALPPGTSGHTEGEGEGNG